VSTLRKILFELILLGIALGLTVEVIKPAVPYLPLIWTLVLTHFTWELLTEKRVLGYASRLRKAMPTRYTMLSYVFAALGGALLLCLYWWGLSTFFRPRIEAYEAEQHKSPPVSKPEAATTAQATSRAKLDNLAEAVWFSINIEATKSAIEQVQSIDPKFLRWYEGNGSVNTVDNLPAGFYETAWDRTFGRLLICDAAQGISAALDVNVSQHPSLFVSLVNNSIGGKCALRAMVSSPPMAGGSSFTLAGDGEPRSGYILDLPIKRDTFGLRFYMTAQQLKQLAQGYEPLWRSYAIDDPEERIQLSIYRRGAAEWKPIANLNQFLPSHITLKTDLLFGGPQVVREFALTSDKPQLIGRGDDASKVYIWAFTWTRTAYRETKSDFGS